MAAKLIMLKKFEIRMIIGLLRRRLAGTRRRAERKPFTPDPGKRNRTDMQITAMEDLLARFRQLEEQEDAGG